MDRVLFEEKQRLPRFIIWIACLVGLGSCTPVFWGIYVQTVLLKPWGSKPMSDTQLVLLLILLLFVVGFVCWMLFITYLRLVIDQSGITYQLFPQHWKVRRIEKAAVAQYAVRKLSWFEKIQRGNRRRSLYGNRRFIMSGDDALVLTLHDGKTITISTGNGESLRWAMGKLMSDQ